MVIYTLIRLGEYEFTLCYIFERLLYAQVIITQYTYILTQSYVYFKSRLITTMRFIGIKCIWRACQ